MIVGIPKEAFPQERRVALVPETVTTVRTAGAQVIIEEGAGVSAGFPDEAYVARNAEVVASRKELFARSEALLQVHVFPADLDLMHEDQVLIGGAKPLVALPQIVELAQEKIVLFALELMPRITRTQSMDILSSMATIAGYKAVLLAAAALPRMFPLLMTAAGTLVPARVLVIGAGVAGLQAISTAKRLGAVVQGYDVRPVVREQIESLGAQVVELDLDSAEAEDAGGYAKAQGADFYQRQQEELGKVVTNNDVVITTAAIPGQPAPILITAAAIQTMVPGSVVVDLAAEHGGNCALTRAGENICEHGVHIMGPINLPASVPYHASQMYAHNISTFLCHLVQEGQLQINMEDEITRETLVTAVGEIRHPRVREKLGPTADTEK